MARNTQEIFEAMIAEKNLEQQLSSLTNNSAAAIWRLMFYIVAAAISTLEKIFDLHKREVTEIIENIIPHRPKWYRDKALNFMKDKTLIPETDQYDTAGMSDESIEAAKIVKYATAVEINGNLLVKIATGTAGNLVPIPQEYEAPFEAYMNEVRDAGVRISLVNQAGDEFACELLIFYDSILLASDVEKNVKAAIRSYITGLPFNGEYSNMTLVDAVQAAEGVKVVTFREARSASNINMALNIINSKTVAEAGYFTYREENINLELKPYVVEQ